MAPTANPVLETHGATETPPLPLRDSYGNDGQPKQGEGTGRGSEARPPSSITRWAG